VSDRTLLLLALSAAVVNAVAGVARTVWHYEKRRAWRQAQEEDQG